ncbi:MAG TPA: glutathione peroxidase [Sandaracinaceae bacterium LLY-WYZ-13_1]|nr:glutathione peroxidase [Sandaracinaceae bacterium LLY-WYZ-13_1]
MSIENQEGQRVPRVTYKSLEDGRLVEKSTDDLFGGRTVVVFSLPGAFTPTCSSAHVPRYDELAPELKKAGVDEIVCVSVNDAFVMEAWKRDQDVSDVTFLPDGNGDFTRGMGMLVDKRALGFGERSWRYSMLVKDGVVEKMFIEPEVEGDPYEVSDADTMLKHVAGEPEGPRDILLFTKPGCGHCARAKQALEEAGLPYAEVRATPRNLRAVSRVFTTPQVFVDGEHVGGADELIARMNQG